MGVEAGRTVALQLMGSGLVVNAVFASVQTSIFEVMSRLAIEQGAINLGQGFPEALEPPALIEAAITALREGPHQYPPAMGLPALRRAVAESTLRFQRLALDWEQEVLVTSGATEALADSFLALLEPGDEAIILEPVYDAYAPLLRRAGAVVVPVRLVPPAWALPVEELARAITPRTRMIVVNHPMNPIGKVFDEHELACLAELAIRHDLIIVADEVYEHLVFDDRRFTSLLAVPGLRDRVVRIGSAGKTFSVTGWKVGYLTACPKLVSVIARAHQFVTFTTPPALQAAVATGLAFPDSYFAGLRQELQRRRDFLVAALRATGFVVDDVAAAYFAIAAIGDLDPEGDDVRFAQRLTREAGVTPVPISSFYGNGDLRSHVRFCFAKRQDTLEEAVARLSAWRAQR